MLEEKDVQAVAQLIDARAEKSEGLLLDEMHRLQTNIEKKLGDIQKNIEMLDTYYRITRLEGDNTKILLQMITDIRKEVEELKQKTA